MARFEWPDLACISSLGGDQSMDVRPVLLRVHADLFVAAPGRDGATIEAFEALALGFLPIVDDATAALVARKLAPIADTPRTILDALIRRGGEARSAVLAERKDLAPAPLLAPPEDQALASKEHAPLTRDVARGRQPFKAEHGDWALALDPDIRRDSSRFRNLVDRAREQPQLAMALLSRQDLSAWDEAVLYLHADDARRAQIRSRLEPIVALAGRGPSLGRADQPAIAALVERALALDTSGFDAQLARMLHLTPAPAWRFQLEPRRELLALALIAAGVAPEDCIRIFLLVHPAISRCAKTVFRMAHVSRTVPRPVAIHLLEAVLDVVIEAKREAQYVPAADPSIASVRERTARPTLAQIRAAVLARRAG